jgi:hypothetical protein
MPKLNDLSRSLVTLEQDATLIAVIEMGQSSWLVAGIVPGVERQPLKKLDGRRERIAAASSSHSQLSRHLGVPTRASCGNGWPWLKKRPAPKFSPSLTTAI